MAVSYSFHLSTKSHALSTVQKVGQVSKHNLRAYKSADYDKNEIEILRGSSKSILDDVKEIYHKEFDSLVEEYNDGRRADRQIKDYLKKVSDSRSDVACEFIIQIGDKDFWKDKTMSEKKQMTYLFADQVKYLEQLVPELKVASAVVHYDEASPHMHIVGVPVASGYKQGLSRQVAKTKVFTAERLSELQDKMRARAEFGMKLQQNINVFGAEVLKEKEKGRNKDIPKYALDEYYQAISMAEKAHNSVFEAESRLNELNKDIESKEAKIKELEPHIESLEKKADNWSKIIRIAEKRVDELKDSLKNIQAKIIKLFSLPTRAERIEAKERYFEALEECKASLSAEDYEAFRKMDWQRISEMDISTSAGDKMFDLAWNYFDSYENLTVDGLVKDIEQREAELNIPKFDIEKVKGRSR